VQWAIGLLQVLSALLSGTRYQSTINQQGIFRGNMLNRYSVFLVAGNSIDKLLNCFTYTENLPDALYYQDVEGSLRKDLCPREHLVSEL